MRPYQSFIFKDYVFDQSTKELVLTYSLDDQITFNEKYRFNFEFDPIGNLEALDRAIQSLFFVAGVSYYKTYLPPKIEVPKGKVDKESANFFADTYQKGLGEFFFVNQLDPKSSVSFPVNSELVEPSEIEKGEGLLVGIGGGKDSLLSVELLRNQPKVATWSLDHRDQLEPLIAE